MAVTANVFTPTAIKTAFLSQQEAFASARIPELNREIIAGQAILANQSHIIVADGFGEACTKINLMVMRSASTDKGSTTFACAPTGGTKAGSDVKALTKTGLVNVERFGIDDTLCNNAVDFGRLWGYMMAKSLVNLEVKLSKALVGALNSNTDLPVTTWFDTTNTLSGDIVQIEKQYFTSDLIADLQWVMKVAELNDGIIINGKNFFLKSILEQYSSNGCCTNDAILNRNNFFNLFWDSQNVDSVTGASSTFLMAKDSLVFYSSPGYSNIGMENMILGNADTYYWVEILPRLKYFANGAYQDIYVDVRATKSCVADAAGIPRDGWNVELALHGVIDTNYADVNGRVGVFRIDQVANS